MQKPQKKQQEKNAQIKVMTLNYSGILLSPFEFYSQQLSPIQSMLSQIFKKCIQQKLYSNVKDFKWNMGLIDKKIQKNRYSPIYNQCVGYDKQTNKLMTELQFTKQWNRWFNEHQEEYEELKVTKDDLENCLTFDYVLFTSIVHYTYKVTSMQNVQMFDPSNYNQLMNKFFSKTYVNQQLKIQKFFEGIQKLNYDVIFLQQTSKQLIQAFKLQNFNHYQIFESRTDKNECLIVVRKDKFKTFRGIDEFISNQDQQIQELLKWNSDMAIAVVDNIILISGHLSSKPQKNKPQVQKMNKCLQKLSLLYPDYLIVVGCDVNSQYAFPPRPFRSFPNSKLAYTNIKRRTFMQAQFHKAQQIIENCVDYLISSVSMKETKIIDLDGQVKNRMNITYIPSDNHPFDHFIVAGIIDRNDLQDKKKSMISSKKSISLKFDEIAKSRVKQ